MNCLKYPTLKTFINTKAIIKKLNPTTGKYDILYDNKTQKEIKLIKDDNNFFINKDNEQIKYKQLRELGKRIIDFFIDINDYKEFININDEITQKEDYDYDLYFVEDFIKDAPAPLLLDFDMHFYDKDDKGEYRFYNPVYYKTTDILIEILERITNINKEILEKEKIFYFLKDDASEYKTYDNKTKKLINHYNENGDMEMKDGWHLFVDIPLLLEDRKLIRGELIKQLKEKDIYKEIKEKIINYDLNEIVDQGPIQATPYMFYNNTKNLYGNYSYPYKLEIDECEYKDFIETIENKSYFFNILKFYLDNIEPLKINRNKLTLTKEEQEDILTDKKTKNKNNNNNNINKELNFNIDLKYLSFKKYTYEDIEQIVELIKPETINAYDDWRNFIWALWSYIENFKDNEELKQKLKNLIHRISAKDKNKYNHDQIEQIINDYKSGPFTLATIFSLAQKDHKIKYNLIKQQINEREKANRQPLITDFKIINENNPDVYFKDIDKIDFFNYDYLENLFNSKKIYDCIIYWNKYNFMYGTEYYQIEKKPEEIEIIKDYHQTENLINYIYRFKKIKIKELREIFPENIFNIELTDYEIEIIKNNRDYNFLINSIKKNKLSLYSLIVSTSEKYKIINSPNSELIRIENYFNINNETIKTDRILNINKISNEFYFNKILSSDNPNIKINDYGVKEIIDFIKNIVCCRNKTDNEEQEKKFNFIMNFIKAIFLRKKNNCVLVLKGLEGTGKSTIGALLENILGYNISHREQGKQLFNPFNSYLGGLLYCLEELDQADTTKQNENNMNIFKDYINNPRVEINEKFEKKYGCQNMCNFIITSNNLKLLNLSPTDRRFVVFEMFKTVNDPNYFKNLYNNFINNEEALINFYNYVKYNTFGDIKDINDFIKNNPINTKERIELIIATSDTYNKFLREFYIENLFIETYKDNKEIKELLKNKKENNIYYIEEKNKILISINQLFKCYKNYCENNNYKSYEFNTFIIKTQADTNLIKKYEGRNQILINKSMEFIKKYLINKNLLLEDEIIFNERYKNIYKPFDFINPFDDNLINNEDDEVIDDFDDEDDF